MPAAIHSEKQLPLRGEPTLLMSSPLPVEHEKWRRESGFPVKYLPWTIKIESTKMAHYMTEETSYHKYKCGGIEIAYYIYNAEILFYISTVAQKYNTYVN